MRRNKLYTVNHWNRPAFMPKEKNLFFPGGDINLNPEQMQRLKLQNLSTNPGGGLSSLGVNMAPQLTTSSLGLGSLGSGGVGSLAEKDPSKFFGVEPKTTGGSSINIGGLAASLAPVAGAALGDAFAGGKSSKVGNAVSTIGSAVLGAAGTAIGGPVGGAIGTAIGQTIGGAINGLWGSSLNQEKISEIDSKNAALEQAGNKVAGANTAEDLLSSWGNIDMNYGFGKDDIGSEGIWNNDVTEEFERLQANKKNAELAAIQGLKTGTLNVDKNLDDSVMANFSAFGGPLFAFGGDLQVNGSDYPTGLTHIDAGLSHELNPNDGVQLGVDPEGVPNLVEEGEVVWNDYVYSNRIKVDDETKKKFHIGKKREITYADLAKKLEKEIEERPNDPISRAGFEAQMQSLEDEQERQKQQMEAEKAKLAFESLSPEEQVAVMQQAAAEEQAAQQAAMQQQAQQQQAMAEQQQMEQQPMMQADGSQAALGPEAQMMACYGGKLFADGGDTKKNIFRALGKATDNDFIKWLEENGLTQLSEGYNDIDWNNILTDDAFISALTKDDATLADAIKKGYSFGAKTPTKDGIVFTDPDRGNWDKQLFAGWNGSKDDAWIELVKAHGVDKLKVMKREDLEKAFKETNAYKNTTKWLQSNPENMRRYLKSVLDTSSSKGAKKHALQFVNEDGTWKDASKIPTYAQIFGENGKGVRETYPGTYWHSVKEANIGNRARNLVWNPENEGWDEVVGDVGKDWTLDSSYDFYNEEDNLNDRVNYYYRSEGEDDFNPVTAEEAKEAETTKNLAPKRSWEGLRYAGLFGPAVGLGMMAAGIGRPDTAQLDAAVANAGKVNLAGYKPIGDYLTYRPMDIWYEQNRMDANARATDRAILNSGANQGSKMAGLLASGYNNQIADGELYRKALEYNDAKRERVAEFNRGTHKYNADAFTGNSRFNASALNEAEGRNLNARLHAASEKLNRDASWYNSLYGNVAGLFKGIGDIGTENKRDNMINWMISKGIFGTVDPNDPEMKKRVKVVSAEGGKLKKNKRRGLTF